MPERRYETLVLIHPEVGEPATRELLNRIRQLMEEQQATVANVHEWGVRDLAYPIAKQRRGFYGLFEFRATAAALAEIERNLGLMDNVLRFLSVHQDEGAPAAAELRTMSGGEGRASSFEAGEGRGRDSRREQDEGGAAPARTRDTDAGDTDEPASGDLEEGL